ncbi:hypothetical protein CMUS01_11740 [Colletotrichum musicola]|uniref:Uncharacterized protein n=1 Tax=Colletotrichum musicola TaxID=2175873 RepID=A0A8H6JTY2_9PEZI|nr:hypothetical protein CMUS01_11740 [Colletotrichum musicola]
MASAEIVPHGRLATIATSISPLPILAWEIRGTRTSSRRTLSALEYDRLRASHHTAKPSRLRHGAAKPENQRRCLIGRDAFKKFLRLVRSRDQPVPYLIEALGARGCMAGIRRRPEGGQGYVRPPSWERDGGDGGKFLSASDEGSCSQPVLYG